MLALSTLSSCLRKLAARFAWSLSTFYGSHFHHLTEAKSAFVRFVRCFHASIRFARYKQNESCMWHVYIGVYRNTGLKHLLEWTDTYTLCNTGTDTVNRRVAATTVSCCFWFVGKSWQHGLLDQHTEIANMSRNVKFPTKTYTYPIIRDSKRL